jgi:hypothetical protein
MIGFTNQESDRGLIRFEGKGVRSRPCLMSWLENQECDRPFIDKVEQLYTTYSVSTILVIGESGD